MRKPAIPNVKIKIAPKTDWPTKGGYYSGILLTNRAGTEVLTIWIQDGLTSYPTRAAAALRMARHLAYIHNQAVEQKLADNRRIKATIKKVKQEGKQA